MDGDYDPSKTELNLTRKPYKQSTVLCRFWHIQSSDPDCFSSGKQIGLSYLVYYGTLVESYAFIILNKRQRVSSLRRHYGPGCHFTPFTPNGKRCLLNIQRDLLVRSANGIGVFTTQVGCWPYPHCMDRSCKCKSKALTILEESSSSEEETVPVYEAYLKKASPPPTLRTLSALEKVTAINKAIDSKHNDVYTFTDEENAFLDEYFIGNKY